MGMEKVKATPSLKRPRVRETALCQGRGWVVQRTGKVTKEAGATAWQRPGRGSARSLLLARSC